MCVHRKKHGARFDSSVNTIFFSQVFHMHIVHQIFRLTLHETETSAAKAVAAKFTINIKWGNVCTKATL